MSTEKKNEMLVSRRTVLKVGAAAAGTAAGVDKIHGTGRGNAQVDTACVRTREAARV